MNTTTTTPRMAWSLSEVAANTGLSLAFLRAEVRGGRLCVRRFGRRVLVTDDELRTYLAQGSQGNKSAQDEQLEDGVTI